MRILISGSTGLVGKTLCPYLENLGHQIVTLQRHAVEDHSQSISWDPINNRLDRDKVEGFDVFINLSGESVQARWNEKAKENILKSRTKATELLSSIAAELQSPPKLILNASAVGFYGNREDQLLDEKSSLGEGFLAAVCQAWEKSTMKAQEAGIRVVLLRFGMILSPKGGALKMMLTPFRLGLGGRLGSGKQYVSWIAIDDVLKIISFMIEHPEIQGPVNVVAPQSVTNEQFTKALGRTLGRPTMLPVPNFVIKLLFGEMGSELLLASTRVIPQKLIDSDYHFSYPDIDSALKALVVNST